MTEPQPHPIYLSPPHLTGEEERFVEESFRSNWIAPLGPNVDAFEREFAELIGVPYALAVNSGTSALHLALRVSGVGPGDEVLVSDLTFAASVFPIIYQDAVPVFVDSEPASWNMDPLLLAGELERRLARGRSVKALVLVHLYGQTANVGPILTICERFGIALIEDAAEALGATYHGRSPGTFGRAGIFSFNGNKIITTSGGGMLVSADSELIARARKLATQARDPAPHYQHSELGYNYRLSNILAGVGRGQLSGLAERIRLRRRNFAHYHARLADLPGIAFMPEASWGHATRWLSCILIDPASFGADREAVRVALAGAGIESRPVWKPMHLQPLFAACDCVGGEIAEDLFSRGLCLPSGSSLTEDDLERVATVIRGCAK